MTPAAAVAGSGQVISSRGVSATTLIRRAPELSVSVVGSHTAKDTRPVRVGT